MKYKNGKIMINSNIILFQFYKNLNDKIKDFNNCRIILILNLMERPFRDDIKKLTQKIIIKKLDIIWNIN